MKYCQLLTTILCVLLVFSSCSIPQDRDSLPLENEIENPVSIERIFEDGYDHTCSYSDLGVLRVRPEGKNKGVCYYFDPACGMEVPICAKVNCNHLGYTFSNTSPTCDACLDEEIICAAIIGDSLYYVAHDSEDGLFKRRLCQANPDGTNRKVLETLEYAEWFISGSYEDGYLMYAYYNQTSPDGEPLPNRQPGMFLYNISTHKAQYITTPDHYESAIYMGTIVDDSLYYFYTYCTEDYKQFEFLDLNEEENYLHLKEIARTELWKYNLATGEQTMVWREVQPGGQSMMTYGYAMIRTADNHFRMINLRTEEMEVLPEDVPRNTFVTLCPEGMLLFGNGEVHLWSFDTRELVNIGTYDAARTISPIYAGDQWVYLKEYDGMGGTVIYYMPKDRFMKGEFVWNSLPANE